jgi:hypothetical protein
MVLQHAQTFVFDCLCVRALILLWLLRLCWHLISFISFPFIRCLPNPADEEEKKERKVRDNEKVVPFFLFSYSRIQRMSEAH